MTDLESPDSVKQLRALADSPVASTAAYASDLRKAATEIEHLREALGLADGALSGANMNMKVVHRKVTAALALRPKP